MNDEVLMAIRQSGEVERFVAVNGGEWGHTEWLEFRNRIHNRFGNFDDDQLGLLLEEEKLTFETRSHHWSRKFWAWISRPSMWAWISKQSLWEYLSILHRFTGIYDFYACVPALGIFFTAGLLVLVTSCLLSSDTLQLNSEPDTNSESDTKIRAFPDKQDDEKSGEKRGFQPPKYAGTVGYSIKDYKNRIGYLDVRAKQRVFLSTWAFFNLFQGALTIVVLIRSLWTILKFTPWRDWFQALFLPFAILFFSVGPLIFLVVKHYLPMPLKGTLLIFLQDSIRKQAGMADRVEMLTTIGNILFGLVVIVTPLAVGVLLLKPVETQKKTPKSLSG